MVEFRVYYDDNGRILCYTCEQLEGKFITVDPLTFARCRHDLLVVDGELVQPSGNVVITKYVESDNGTKTTVEDICIVVDNYNGPTKTWKLETNEYN